MYNIVGVLRSLNVQNPDLDTLVSFSAAAKSLRAEYEALGIDIPEWLDGVQRSLRNEIKARNSDALEARRAEIRTRLNAMKPAEERRKELQEELERLEKQLV